MSKAIPGFRLHIGIWAPPPSTQRSRFTEGQEEAWQKSQVTHATEAAQRPGCSCSLNLRSKVNVLSENTNVLSPTSVRGDIYRADPRGLDHTGLFCHMEGEFMMASKASGFPPYGHFF